MCRTLAAIAGITLVLARPAAAGSPPRVVSLNLCADQFLLAFAPRERIASLSPSAADPAFSFHARLADGLPRNAGDGERIALAPPALVIAGPWDQRARRLLLERAGAPVHVVGFWDSFEDGAARIRATGKALEADAAAEALVAAIEAGRDGLRALSLPPKRFLILQRRGYVPGPANLIGLALREAGLVDATADWGLPFGGLASMERILVEAPDLLVVTAEDENDEDIGSAVLQHPALAARYPADKRLALPRRLTLCDGPATPAMLALLAERLSRMFATRTPPNHR